MAVGDVEEVDGDAEEVEGARDDECTCRVADVALLLIVVSGVDVRTLAMIRYVAAGVPSGTVRPVNTVVGVWAGRVSSEVVARREEEAEVTDWPSGTIQKAMDIEVAGPLPSLLSETLAVKDSPFAIDDVLNLIALMARSVVVSALAFSNTPKAKSNKIGASAGLRQTGLDSLDSIVALHVVKETLIPRQALLTVPSEARPSGPS